jgi:hypothetical protein
MTHLIFKRRMKKNRLALRVLRKTFKFPAVHSQFFVLLRDDSFFSFFSADDVCSHRKATDKVAVWRLIKMSIHSFFSLTMDRAASAIFFWRKNIIKNRFVKERFFFALELFYSFLFCSSV